MCLLCPISPEGVSHRVSQRPYYDEISLREQTIKGHPLDPLVKFELPLVAQIHAR